MDTEADSLHHYIEKLCLVQISVPGQDFIIDPLAAFDLRPLMLILEKKPLIFHGADFDMRILKKSFNFNPVSIFDTMIAAQLLGYEKMGLADLAYRHCGVVLPKGAQKADWSQRPLDGDLLVYAAGDTHYLRFITDKMTEELEDKGRTAWHRQACEKLVRTIQSSKEGKADPDAEWQIKGSKILKGASLTILREIWYWREAEARKKDRPPFKVLNADIMIDISVWAAENSSTDVAMMPKAPRPLRNEYRDSLNEAILKAKASPPAIFKRRSESLKPKFWSEESKLKLGLLKTERDRLGKELSLQSSLLATNAILETLALELPKNIESLESLACMMPWQIEVAGPSFLKIIGD